MKHVLLALTALSSPAALADGFVCQTQETQQVYKVYNHTSPLSGTRTAAVMVISDPAVQDGRKTIARFSDVNGTLTSSEMFYDANVDLRFNDSSRKGENVGGTKLGELDMIRLVVGFSYANPVEDGDDLSGYVRFYKRNGETWIERADCQRYLKN